MEGGIYYMYLAAEAAKKGKEPKIPPVKVPKEKLETLVKESGRAAYMREYMRKKRAAKREQAKEKP